MHMHKKTGAKHHLSMKTRFCNSVKKKIASTVKLNCLIKTPFPFLTNGHSMKNLNVCTFSKSSHSISLSISHDTMYAKQETRQEDYE